MNLGHLHISFQDLSGAVKWMKQFFEKEPAYQNPNMAVFTFNEASLIFDKSDVNTDLTIAFNSENCDKDFAKIVERGAEIIESPSDKDWGVRVAYIKGPGSATIEIEQQLP